MKSVLHRRHAPFYVAVVCALAALPPALWFWPQLTIQAIAIIFFLIYLALESVKIPSLTADFLKEYAASEDEPAWVIVAVAFAAVMVAVASLFVLINKGGRPSGLELGLSLASVALGWLTVHTMAAHHYAHRYWRPDMPAGSAKTKKAEPHGGLDFPGDDEPCGYDFLYFSLVTGMTAQTSDVAVTKTKMRKLNLVHAVTSFFFNTVLVAAAVNVAVSLGD
jgi:uncharacterized membrane protein